MNDMKAEYKKESMLTCYNGAVLYFRTFKDDDEQVEIEVDGNVAVLDINLLEDLIDEHTDEDVYEDAFDVPVDDWR